MSHIEPHRIHRSGWLRAAVLGANDGIVSTACLITGIAVAGASSETLLLAGTAGLAAGAMSMAAGEYVSVRSQHDIEVADLKIEIDSLENNREGELKELAEIYRKRGLNPELADQVAHELMEHDALGAHARDDIGIIEELSARPYQAALTSGGMFAIGAAIPLITTTIAPVGSIFWVVPACAIITLAALGAFAAKIGGASPLRGALRMCTWGTLAMALTALVGKIFGIAV
ncbi:VIT1/CCC1 transporter family protein [Luteolibacter sp. AS25]|uniref:VIT1/CCC1 transporter family protein n=1 Tax=Luteolibacter sp. AS25 TaxID=3135776 RepID=UPI00398BAA9F